jgi:cytochrome c-type biogenesis protein CcmH/NrfF
VLKGVTIWKAVRVMMLRIKLQKAFTNKQTNNPKNDEKHDSYFSLKLPLLCRIISGNALHQSGVTVAMRIKPQNAN